MPPAKKSAKKAAKKAAPKKASKKAARKTPTPERAASTAKAAVLVPDTSVLVDGRVTMRIQHGEIKDCRVIIPNAAVAELENQANRGRESGFAGLDEIVKIQELKDTANLQVDFGGERPTADQVEMARGGEIDALIRQVAVEHHAKLLTSDRVQAHVARALGLDVEWMRPVSEPEALIQDLDSLEISTYFDDETMSVHLKQNVPPLAKKGRPGDMQLVQLHHKPMELRDLTRMRRDIIEAARRDENSFIEIERHGATVVQLGRMRIAIAQPPFSDAVEITAVRPIIKLDFDAYDLGQELQGRLRDHHRGVFVSGAPGSGKSTFVTAIAEWLKDHGTIVKTMESPRDLQVSDDITQYAPLDNDMALTSDVLLLVRPDFVVYDEVRKTSDFTTFADMRLAGVGLVGVTHANRAIDAIQRLIGRVELGMIPQVVDTVIHIEDGKVAKTLELSFTVKTPAGMTEADLARPVIEVRDFITKESEYEIYTYGEQVVVMPIGETRAPQRSGKDKLASQSLQHMIKRFVDGPFEVEITGDNKATLLVPEHNVPMIIGRGGSNIKVIENAVGMKVDVRPMAKKTKAPDWTPLGKRAPVSKGRFDPNRPLRREDNTLVDDEDETEDPDGRIDRRYAEIRPELRKSKKNLVLLLRKEYAGETAEIMIDDKPVMRATIGNKGDIRISRDTEPGQQILDAIARGSIIMTRI